MIEDVAKPAAHREQQQERDEPSREPGHDGAIGRFARRNRSARKQDNRRRQDDGGEDDARPLVARPIRVNSELEVLIGNEALHADADIAIDVERVADDKAEEQLVLRASRSSLGTAPRKTSTISKPYPAKTSRITTTAQNAAAAASGARLRRPIVSARPVTPISKVAKNA